MQDPISWLVNSIFEIYFIFIIAYIVLSWLINFNIINRYQPFVQQVGVFLNRVTEPALRRIRKIIPPMGGLDLAPLVLILLVLFLQKSFNWVWYKFL